MSKSTGVIYLSWTRGPGDYFFLLDEQAWLFEFGFYAGGVYHILREERSPASAWVSNERVKRAATVGLILAFLVVILTPSPIYFAIAVCIGVPSAIIVYGGRQRC